MPCLQAFVGLVLSLQGTGPVPIDPGRKLHEETRFIDSVTALPFLLQLEPFDQQDNLRLIEALSRISFMPLHEIRMGMAEYVSQPPKRSRDLDYFKLYTLNRFICNVPRNAPLSIPMFREQYGPRPNELWPWRIKDGEPFFVGNSFQKVGREYDPIHDFERLLKRYGLRVPLVWR